MNTVTVPLTQGKVAIIDEADAERVLAHKWYAWESRKHWYARRNVTTGGDRRQRGQTLHVFLMEPPDGMEVHHWDNDGLNCTRENMVVTKHAGHMRSAPKRKDSQNRYKGVTFHPRTNRWQAKLQVNGKNESLGYYATEEEAARAYDARAYEISGIFARLNFPDEPPVPFKKPETLHNNTSGYRGVSYFANARTFVAYITVNGKRKHLGSFKDAESAFEARKEAERAAESERAPTDR